MKRIEINETFKEEYLTCGASYDNYIFEDCPTEFVEEAEKLLRVSQFDVKPCNVKITREDEIKFEKTMEKCKDNYQTKILARDFVTALIMREVVKDFLPKGQLDMLNEQIKAFMENDLGKVVEFHKTSFMPYEVAEMQKNVGEIEINIFLIDTKNVELQKAINNFISSRTPYSVKLFTNNRFLPSYVDEAGNLIQPPHDYLSVNVNNFIEINDGLITD